jgi:dTDP-4-amino-4,6-dideoxygalactose transaminase
MRAAMLLVNLERIASMFECRREIANCYQTAIDDLVERPSTGSLSTKVFILIRF